MKELTKKITKILDSENCKFVLIGAHARDIFFEQNGIKLEVGTKDVDFAVLVDDWVEFESIKDKIKKELNATQDAKIYRIKVDSIPIDLLPFGKIEDGNSTIKWPSGFRERMKVMGFKEAYQNAVDIDVDGVKIKTIVPEMLIALKISSWSHGNRAKDAIDIFHIFKNINALCKDLMTDDSLFIKVLDEKFSKNDQKTLIKLGLRINLLLKESELKPYIRNVLESGYNQSEIIKDINESNVPDENKKSEIRYYLDPFILGILHK